MQKEKNHSDRPQRLLAVSYATLAAVVLSIVLSLTAHVMQVSRGGAEIAKLRDEMVEIKRQMADRSDLQAVRKSLLQLEKDVKKVSDNLPKGR